MILQKHVFIQTNTSNSFWETVYKFYDQIGNCVRNYVHDAINKKIYTQYTHIIITLIFHSFYTTPTRILKYNYFK